MKKQRFYVQCGVFGKEISAGAMCLYFFLCKCANAESVCFPNRNTITKNTGLSRSTITRGIAELKDAGLIECQPRYQKTEWGKQRQTSNLYTILDLE